MTASSDEDGPAPEKTAPKKKPGALAQDRKRAERLAAALRTNIQRRKAAGKAEPDKTDD